MRCLMALAAVFMSVAVIWGAQPPLVIHEWGTFTTLQDENGRALGGLNADDEPLPPFVHTIAPYPAGYQSGKGLPARCHPDVTMRLETPVVYFHPPQAAKLPIVLDLSVEFRGGWLTQFYPDATVSGVPGAAPQATAGTSVPITSRSIGRLFWNGLRIGTTDDWPATDMHVWTAPRRVQSAQITSQKDEAERYLFYRGVGHINAPIRIERDGSQLKLFANDSPGVDSDSSVTISAAWLVHIGQDGDCAFRVLGALRLGPDKTAQTTAATFQPAEYRGLPALRAEMHRALLADGLFADEAEAMLSTWDASYFKSAGDRLFYLVPRPWTDEHLPFTVSTQAKVTRTMVGRLEIVTPEQRAILRRIAMLPAAAADGDVRFNLYKSLGRFRNALALDELEKRPSESLAQFVELHGLQPLSIPRSYSDR